MNEVYKLLIIEDQEADVDLLLYDLKKSFKEEQLLVTHEKTLDKGIESLISKDFDVIFLDLNLPDSFGLKSVSKIFNHSEKEFVYVISGIECKEKTEALLKMGVKRYFTKGQIDSSLVKKDLESQVDSFRSLNS